LGDREVIGGSAEGVAALKLPFADVGLGGECLVGEIPLEDGGRADACEGSWCCRVVIRGFGVNTGCGEASSGVNELEKLVIGVMLAGSSAAGVLGVLIGSAELPTPIGPAGAV
jgi:hypothetical protein